jgi:hypothetical protein
MRIAAYPAQRDPRFHPVIGRLLFPAAVLLAFLSVSAAGAATAPGKIVLRPAQVGPGYHLRMRPDSHCVAGCVTLDMCGFTFTSERLRTRRLQVDFIHPGRAVVVSNEVVTYRNGGAALAMHEVERAVATCPPGPVDSHVQGVGPLTYRITRLTGTHLLPGYIALRQRISGKDHGRKFAQTNIVIFQSHGSVLSGVYTTATAGVTVADQIRVGLHAAQGSADNLGRAA